VKIEDSFRVDVPVEEAWDVLLDVERIAPCMPGAQLQEVEGNEFRGIVKIKVGPITAQYKGAAQIVEADEAARKVVLKAEGRDTRGQGNASAMVTATLTADGDGTVVNIDTDLNITGKVAQFGRGVMADVSSKLLGQFADNLKRDVLTGEAPTIPVAEPERPAADAPGVRKLDHPEPEPIDLAAHAGPIGKRLAPVIAAVVALITLRVIVKRCKRRKAAKRAQG
jgi:carbon monoxide dehydrogenase subunit G